jgi:hypothetical protein
MRMSPRAPGRREEPSAAMPAPSARPGRRRTGSSRADAMSALCTTRRKIPFRISWRSVVWAARDGHRIPWSLSQRRRVAPQVHCCAGALEGSMLKPRRWRRPVRTSPLLSSRARVQGSVSSQAEAGRQVQLDRRARTLLPYTLLAS